MANQDGKWRGSVSEIIPAPIDKTWEILSDFDGLHRHFPQVFRKCDHIVGEVNKVGAIRSLEAPLPDGTVITAKEKLLAVDHVKHTTSYSIEESNLGWTDYFGHISAESTENGQTRVVWSFELNPTENGTEEEYVTKQKGLFETLLSITKETLSK